MRVSFMRALPEASTGPAFKYPRIVRKAMRLETPKQRYVNTHDGVDDYMAAPERTDAYLMQNLTDCDYDHDEFGDIDDEHEGLTMTSTMTESELFEFCTGYNTI
jgi:hypothetical protein